MTEYEIKIIEKLQQSVIEGQISNECLVQIIEQCGSFLNLKTISNYAKENSISYNGAKKFRENIELFGVKFILDND
jgi:hypothetical protein